MLGFGPGGPETRYPFGRRRDGVVAGGVVVGSARSQIDSVLNVADFDLFILGGFAQQG